MEIAKRLNAIIAQLLPFLSQEVSSSRENNIINAISASSAISERSESSADVQAVQIVHFIHGV